MNLSVFPNICGLRVECSHARRPNTLAPGSRCCFHARMFPWIFSKCPGPSRAGWLSRGVHSSVLSQTGKRASGRCAVSRQDPQKPFQAPVPEPTDKGASAQSPGSPQASWVAFTNSLSSLCGNLGDQLHRPRHSLDMQVMGSLLEAPHIWA